MPRFFKKQTARKEQSEEEFSRVLDLSKRKISQASKAENRTTEFYGEKHSDNATIVDYGRETFLNKKSEENVSFDDNCPKTKWAKIGKFLLYALIFLVPLFFLPFTSSPVGINKLVLAMALVILSFICYLADSIAEKKIVYPKSLVALAVLAVIFSVLLSSTFSQSKSASVWGNLIQPDSLIAFIIYGLAFFLAAVIFRRSDSNKIGIAFLSGLTLAAIIGLAQLTGKFILPFDFTGNIYFNTIGSSLDFGFFIAFGLILIIAALSELRLSLVLKIILSAASLLVVAELIMLNWRYLWLGIAAAMAILLAKKFSFSHPPIEPDILYKEKSGIGMPLAAMIVSLLFFLISPSLPPMVDLPTQINPDFSSTLLAAKNSLKGSRLIIGSGPATFGYNFLIVRPVELNRTNFWPLRFNQGFSFLATALTTVGVLGILALLFLIFSFIFKSTRGLNKEEALIISLGVMFLISGWFFYQPFLAQFIFIFLGLGLILSFSSSTREISLASARKAWAFMGFMAIIVLIAGSLVLSYLVGQKYAAAVYYQKGIASGNMENSLFNLGKAIILDPDSDQYARDFSQFILLDANNQKEKIRDSSVSSEDANRTIQNKIALAVQIAQKAIVINPADPLNWSNLANIYEKIIPIVSGADTFAEKNYKEAMDRDPKNPVLPVSLAKTLIASSDLKKAAYPRNTGADGEWAQKLEEANSVLGKAIELKADYAPAHFQMAMIYVRQGKIKEAIKKLEETKIFAPSDSDLSFHLGFLYYSDKQLDKARLELERAVSLNENYSNARYLLGLIYDKKGDKDKALLQFQKIAALNKDNQEIKKIIKNLTDGKDALSGSEPSMESMPVIPAAGAKSETGGAETNSME